jgi:uncharacterized repeat protein (TIGR01451 family)
VGLGFEALEPRQMLAADMAEIVGTIRLDVQNDGDAANDALVQGALVRLYRDGGDGVFNPAGDDVSTLPDVVTDSNGQYRFVGVGAGTYFVEIILPSGMQTVSGGGVKSITISAAEAAGAIGRTIDEFDSFQKVEASPPPNPSGVSSTKADAAVLGGERDFHVEITGGTDEYSSVALISAGGLLRLASGAMVTGNATIVWDGADGDADSINYTGLGGLDFTHDSGNTMTGIRLSVGADHPNSIVKLRVYSDATHWSEFTTTVPESAGGAIDKQAVFDFANPTRTGGGGADFANVGAMELVFEGVSAVDAQISVAELVGLTTKTADFTAYSQLSLGDQVWHDVNNNGLFDSGEQGIAGVKLNLYADSDGNSQFTPAVDALVDSTVTDASGRYLFTGLFAGSYIVQVDSANFGVGQPLAGWQSSTGKTAADPDDDIDHDDNGTPLSGHGVVSQTITLAALAEPASDGDDANSNRTLDFGFFGFDLELHKSVDQTAVSPQETLTYSVLVVNDGPSTARSVQFEDTLPVDVTFTSATTSNGVTLAHNGGVVTGNLGNMAAGQQIIITIIAEVKSSAAGLLVNEAEVSAQDELNLSNNKDRVETPVTPKIDLAIDKSDSQDPVEPGQSFNYKLRVTNNGPSNATGVRVIDVLPPQVTFVTASHANLGNADQLEFNLGSLAAGAAVEMTIQVTVDQSYVGPLLNHAQVSGNEAETNYDNNEDTEPTVVKANPASLGGNVYVDKDNDGVRDANERAIQGVIITLTGNDLTGDSVTRTTVTDANGRYQFDDLMPGTYNVAETHPTRYRDGKDTLGNTFDAAGVMTEPNGFIALDTNDEDDFDADAFQGIVLGGGFEALDYNFGEQAVTVSKAEFVGRANW